MPELHRFHGGLHLPDNKQLTRDVAITECPLPTELVLPLQMHIGDPAQPVVQVGEHVGRGQLLAVAEEFVSAGVHAPTSGTVVAIEERPIPHPGGLSAMAIVLEPDGEDRWVRPFERWPDYTERSPVELRARLREAGIVGLGGAVFPTAVKMAVANPGAVHTLVLNGAECEPYITCDDRLMRERPEDILLGAQIVLHVMGSQRCLIGIEDNKPEAIEALRQAISTLGDDRFEVVPVPTIYPAGGEKQLLRVLTGIEVPRGKRTSEYGLLCLNVATVAAVRQAVVEGEPMTDRIVTVTGPGVREPGNFRVRIGTPMSHVVAQAGGYADGVDRLVMGGPMMGFPLHEDEVPVVKATNCLLALRPQDRPEERVPQPCIRCSRCSDACPADLLPQQLYWYARSERFDRAAEYHLFDCIECGVCTAVCPSHIPLVQYFRFAKTEIWSREREKAKADQARSRFEFRNERLERQKAEREAALAKKRAAMEAAKKKQAAAKAEAGASEQGASSPNAAADAAKTAESGTAETGEMSIEAARARAKARREARQAAQAVPTSPESTPTPPASPAPAERPADAAKTSSSSTSSGASSQPPSDTGSSS